MSDPHAHFAFQAPEPAKLAPLFPGYEIETLIATGGMGAVYRAIQKSLDRTVAIKILPNEFSNDAAFCAGFEAEAKAMARLNHPNLIGVYDFGEVNGMLYIIMEYVPGQSLFHSAHGIAIDPGEVIRLVSGICDGLAHAHEHGILHRDIKPSNILLDLNAQPKIGDFGLARPIDTKIQEGEEIFGTPHYTAPEVIETPHSVDHRADIFSVGVLLHELLTGLLPAQDPRSPSAIAHCDPRFDAIVRRATYPQPAGRYNSAADIARDLHAISASAGLRVPRTQSPRTVPKPVIRPGNALPAPKKSSGSQGLWILLITIIVAALAYKFLSRPESATEAPSPPPAPVVQQTHHQTAPDPKRDSEVPQVASHQAEPKPDSQAATANKPATLPEESTAGTLPEHDPVSDKPTPAAPKFDVAGFFDRACRIMQERATPLIAARNESLAKNLEAFDRGVRRLIRKINLREIRTAREDSLKDFLEACKQDGNRIPNQLDFSIGRIQDIEQVHDEFLAKQDAIDTTLLHSLAQLAPTYILGLEKQIERLQGTDDPAAISLIQKEIDKTREDESHFPNLMLGKESAASSTEDDSANKLEKP